VINQSTNNAEAPEDVQERATNETAVYFLIRLVYVLLFGNALILIGVGAILGILMHSLVMPLGPLGGP